MQYPSSKKRHFLKSCGVKNPFSALSDLCLEKRQQSAEKNPSTRKKSDKLYKMKTKKKRVFVQRVLDIQRTLLAYEQRMMIVPMEQFSTKHGTLEHWNNVRVLSMTKSTLKIIIGVPLHVELLYGHIESVFVEIGGCYSY